MILNRRNWFYLASATLFGCGDRKAPAPAKPLSAGKAARVQAGAFSVEVPAEWTDSARIEKVPARPLYTPEEWKQVQAQQRERSIAAMLKPHYGIRPQHWAVRLPAALPAGFPESSQEAGDDPTAPQILIHKADEWAAIFTDGIDGLEKAQEQIQELRRSLELSIREPEGWPSPAYMDAFLAFRYLKTPLNFDGGHGYRMVAQWCVESEIMRKGQLHYLFVGMSDDNSCQIVATFPLSLPGLPGDSPDAEHLGRSARRWEELNQHYEDYLKDGEVWLSNHAAEINPSLDMLDDMLKSLVVHRWE